jgi:hypothetical protein
LADQEGLTDQQMWERLEELEREEEEEEEREGGERMRVEEGGREDDNSNDVGGRVGRDGVLRITVKHSSASREESAAAEVVSMSEARGA